MSTRVLVANRSEIACRIFQTCKEMGLIPVGIVAPGDEEGRHLTYADEVYEVKSYLDIDSVVAAAVKAKAKLIHPGYGFLSERSAFAKAVEIAGIGFAGPTAAAMEILGGKISAKELAIKHQVPILPWARVERGSDIVAAAKKVGFPLLIKASAGGGGKGMRRIDRPEDLAQAAESASAEALAAFGDGTLFLERYIVHPRHIEVQVFGDGKGDGIHLFERECSLQRRHQKIWEEAPAPRLTEKTRLGLYEAALKLVRATSYRSAGTVEFLVDSHSGKDESFYFLEMNTRLQVEHPVTESITGVDLVRAQISQILEGATLHELFPLPLEKRGHSIEVRLYAEDPAQGFIPTGGTVQRLRWPTGNGIRIESGIEEGQSIGTQFDSMLAKVIVSAQDRKHAIERLKFALEDMIVFGVGTNQSFLHSLTLDSDVRNGKMSTDFVDLKLSALMPPLKEEEISWVGEMKSQGFGKAHGNSIGSIAAGTEMSAPSPWSALWPAHTEVTRKKNG